MGLDLLALGCAKPGHGPEWRSLVERQFADNGISEEDIARFQEISIPAYESIGAPRVGFDNDADAWIIEARAAKTPEEAAAVLKEFHGYHVLALAKCDGIPEYSNGGMYNGVDATSFRGAFLKDCQDVLSDALLNEAWNSKWPEAAVAYGRALLAAADAADAAGRSPKRRRTLFSRLGLVDEVELVPMSEQLDIVRAAGRWYTFWGERGHPIHAWF